MLSRHAGLILLVLFAGLLLLMIALGTCVQEDAYISFRYARNLVRGHGLVYNVGERVEGYTNFLWTLLIAGGMSVGIDPVPLARFLGMGVTLLLVAWVYRSARRWENVHADTGGVLAVCIAIAPPGLIIEGVQGLETLLYTFLVTAGVLLAAEARAKEAEGEDSHLRSLLGGTIVLALAALTRPDGLGIFGLVTVGALAWRKRRSLPVITRGEILAVVLFLAIYAPYWLWRFNYYGYPFPNTFYAKTGGGIWHVLRGLEYVGRFLLVNPALALIAAAAVLAPIWRWRAAAARSSVGAAAKSDTGSPAATHRDTGRSASALWTMGVIVVIGYLLYVIWAGGDFKETFRFMLPVLPLGAVMIEASLSRWAWPALRERAATRARSAAGKRRKGRGPSPDTGARGPAGWAPAILCAVLLANGIAQISHSLEWVQKRKYDLRRRKACAMHLKSVASPGDVLAIHSAGIIPYYTELPTIDMWGITNLHIAHKEIPDMGRSGRLPGHEKEDYPWVFAQNPTYYIDKWFVITRRPMPDLLERIFATPASRSIAERYLPHSVPMHLDLGEGLQRYWFNYVELRDAYRR